jgi:hypothetical protein
MNINALHKNKNQGALIENNDEKKLPFKGHNPCKL